LGLSPLVIGLTIVAYGTSAPELMVSVVGAWEGRAEIAAANVIGSNIFNVLFVLGACALVAPLKVASQLLRLDTPIMVCASLATLLFALDGRISIVESLLLLSSLLGYTALAIWRGKRDGVSAGTDQPRQGTILGNLLLIGLGLALLVAGANWLISGSVVLAAALGISETVIGLTLIAAGTSLPEVATSIVATIRGQRDIAIGNIVGSNIYNIFAILGLSGIASGDGLTVSPALQSAGIPVMVLAAAVCLPLFLTGKGLSRWEGALLLGYYILYVGYLVLEATRPSGLPIFTQAMWTFVVPATALLLFVSLRRSFRAAFPARAGIGVRG
jgi:cation:H+ antiporter